MVEKQTSEDKKNVTKKAVSKKITEEISNQSKVFLKNIRISPFKLNLTIAPIRGLKVDKAMNYLAFSNKRIASDVKKALNSAIANAENNHQLDVDKLFVYEATVGKGMVMKRFRPRAKGRGARIMKPFSNLTIKLKEQDASTKIKNNKSKKKLKEGENKDGSKS